MKRIILTLLFIVLGTPMFSVVQALEVDAKLTLRILSVSQSKKTILINRGIEDGLVVDDYAQFFTSTGIIARGVVIKVSPARSVWALFRITDPDQLYPEKVLNLKITAPVRVTEDASKSLSVLSADDEDETDRLALKEKGVRDAEGNLYGGASDPLAKERLFLAKKQAANEMVGNLPSAGRLGSARPWEVFGDFYLRSFSVAFDQEDTIKDAGRHFSADLNLGLERFLFETDKLQNIGIIALIHLDRVGSGVYDSNNVTEFGLGARYYFQADPREFNRIMGIAEATFGIGASTRGEKNFSAEGSSNFYSVGVGAKVYNFLGMGFTGFLDYYQRAENYGDFSYTYSGVRVRTGLSYRF